MYCSKCGNLLNDNVIFCPNCGTRVAQDAERTANTYQQPYQKTPTQTLADREKASAFVWTGIASLQCVIGILTISGLLSSEDIIGMSSDWSGLLTLALAGYNAYGAYCSFQRVNRILARQRGIVYEYDKMLTNSIIFIVLNALFGAIFGMAGAIFDLCNRNYALNNSQYLED